MATWKKTLVKPNRILYTVGKFIPGRGYINWIHIDKIKNTYAQKYIDRDKIIYEVGASKKINPKTINGHFKEFKTKASAMRFAKAYMNKY